MMHTLDIYNVYINYFFNKMVKINLSQDLSTSNTQFTSLLCQI